MEPEILVDGPGDAPRILILAHGAGAPMDSGFMETLARGIAARGLRVVRFEFPYMRRRRALGAGGPPDRQDVLLETWREIALQFRDGGRLFIGGKSMGGRMASLVADECEAAGLVCLGYPFHPPGRPRQLRTAHLGELRTPTLILQGACDALGTREEIAGYRLSPAIRLAFLEDGDHSFKPRARSARSWEQNLEEATRLVAEFVLHV